VVGGFDLNRPPIPYYFKQICVLFFTRLYRKFITTKLKKEERERIVRVVETIL